ncbi:hypothetical protein JXD38_06690 [candidate division WOR-3 bacterium]|nr:hypothetical protein [candidate division WOR-3 bacterium]
MGIPETKGDSISSPLPNYEMASPETRRWTPRRIGPRFAWLDHDNILIIDGPLSERRFEVGIDVLPDSAVVRLREDGNLAGAAHIERSPVGRGIVLSNAAVGPRYRRGGLAAVMTWCVFRELLAMQETATFRIRMTRSIKPRATDTQVRNIGIGIIAARLGLRPELPVETLVREDNIIGTSAIPGGGDRPPALRISLRSYPFVLVAVALSPRDMKPLLDSLPYEQLGRDGSQIQNWLRQGVLLAGEDYCLDALGVDRFVNALATDDEEAVQFRSKIRPL